MSISDPNNSKLNFKTTDNLQEILPTSTSQNRMNVVKAFFKEINIYILY